MKLKRLLLPILAAVVLTVLATLAVLNLRAEKEIGVRPMHLYPVSDQQFLRSMGVLLGPPLLDGNRVDTLLNGDRIFPSMLQAISGAQQTIDFETYIYWSGEIGKRFAEALSERARAGVKVNVLVDWLGSQKMDNDSIETMKQAGVDFRKYRPLRWYNLGRVNNRTHRKLLVVDGRIGFTGGVGVADNWTGNAQDPDHWRDNHYHVKLLVVDGVWSSVGSTNFDSRSFQLNDEANLNVYDADFARLQTETFETDLKQAQRLTYEQWEARPWHEKLKERGAALFSSQL